MDSLLARLLQRFLPADTQVDPQLQQQVNQQIFPKPATAQDGVGGLPPARVRITDPRAGGNLTGRYPANVVNEIAAAAPRHGVDPGTALALAFQETTLGTGMGRDGYVNPLNEMNYQESKHPGVNVGHLHLADSGSPEARDFSDRTAYLDAALDHIKQLQQRAGPEERQLQAFTGFGVPKFNGRQFGGAYGAQNFEELPPNYYGKRVLDIRDNVVGQSPLLRAILR
jgi:hypothetical protein